MLNPKEQIEAQGGCSISSKLADRGVSRDRTSARQNLYVALCQFLNHLKFVQESQKSFQTVLMLTMVDKLIRVKLVI